MRRDRNWYFRNWYLRALSLISSHTGCMVRRIASSIFVMASWLAADSGAGIKWTAPSNWKTEAERPMRLATYTIPPAAGDSEPAECGVYVTWNLYVPPLATATRPLGALTENGWFELSIGSYCPRS